MDKLSYKESRGKIRILFGKNSDIIGLIIVFLILYFLPYDSRINDIVQVGLICFGLCLCMKENSSVFIMLLLFCRLPVTLFTATHSADVPVMLYYMSFRSAILLVVCAFILEICKRNTNFFILNGYSFSFLLGAYMLLSRVWTASAELYTDAFSLVILTYLLIPMFVRNDNDIKRLWKTYTMSGVVFTGIMLAFAIPHLLKGDNVSQNVIANGNYLTLFIIILIMLISGYMYQYRAEIKGINKAILIAAIIGLSVMLVYYESRTGFLMMILYTMVLLCMLMWDNKRFVITTIVIGTAALILLNRFDIFDTMLKSFAADDVSTANGRTILWSQFITEFKNESFIQKLFGRGHHVFRGYYAGARLFSHNSYLNILIDFGLFGEILYIGIMLKNLFRIFCGKYRVVSLALLVIMIYCFFIEGHQDIMCALFFAFCTGISRVCFLENKSFERGSK